MAGRAAAIWALALGQTLGYACLYYIFAALVTYWQADWGWSKPALAVGPTCAVLISGALAPVMGRWIDRGGSRWIMGVGTCVGVAGLALLALSEGYLSYLIAWVILGLAQAAVLYEVCFAILMRRLAGDARAAIARVTLVAGFASTLAFPVAALVSDSVGWRGAVWLAAGLVVFVQLPLNLWATGVLRRGERPSTAEDKAASGAAWRGALRKLRFWLLGGVLALLSLNHWMLIAFVIPLFTGLGATGALAVAAAALVGPAQVAGRLALMGFEARAPNALAFAVCVAAMAVASGVLFLAVLTPAMVFVFAALQGAAMGVMTILRPVLISDVLGHEGYGAIAGSVQVMPLMAGAAAPLVGGVLFEAGGPAALIWLSLILVLASGLGGLALRRA